MTGKTIEVVVAESGRLDKVLLQLWPEDPAPSRTQFSQWIKKGYVTVNGSLSTKPGLFCTVGNTIKIELPAPEKQKEVNILADGQLLPEVLFADDHIVVVNKPAGLVVHPGAGTRGQATLSELMAPMGFKMNAGESGRPGIVHRLDKDTSGVMVLARTSIAHASLSKQFAERTIEKHYRAVVIETSRRRTIFGTADTGIISEKIIRDPACRTRMTVHESEGREAETRWTVVERFARGVLLDLEPKTGRTHQIRVHCYAQKGPLYGDSVYRREDFIDSFVEEAEKVVGRQALHAYSLGLLHPVSETAISFQADIPEDFGLLLDFLRGSVGSL